MKKSVLIFVTFVMVSYTQLAANNSLVETNTYGKSFTFVENGITFAVFQNGAFDFYLNDLPRTQVNYQINNVNISFNAGYNYNAFVQYDDFGAVIQIKNTPVYYDYYGRVTRIGNLNVQYHNGQLIRLGNMQVYYNHGRYAYYRGYINPYNRYYVYQPAHNCFVQPYYDYAIVSHRPYRTHYKEHRYAYNNYSKHYENQGNNGHKPKSNERSQTNKVPKQRSEAVAINNRNNGQVQNYERNNNSTQRANSNSTKRSNTTTVRKPVKTNERSATAAVTSRDLQKREVRTSTGKRTY